jgi:hypothetical protein
LNDPVLVAYLDSSALVKLVVPEPESRALVAFIGAWPKRVSSRLAQVELLRAVRRCPPDLVTRTRRVLATLTLREVDGSVAEAAGLRDPPSMRSLDAIHLATAMMLGDSLGVFVAYDARMQEAARAAGLEVSAPS